MSASTRSIPYSEPVQDFVNGCCFCGHQDCADACCDACSDPKCYRTHGVCPTCTAIAEGRELTPEEIAACHKVQSDNIAFGLDTE